MGMCWLKEESFGQLGIVQRLKKTGLGMSNIGGSFKRTLIGIGFLKIDMG